MSGTITLNPAIADGVAEVVLSNPGKLNAIDIAMWQQLRVVSERLQALPVADAPRAVVVRGALGQFACGGDIHEFAGFRFDPERLRRFHEDIVAPAWAALWACDVPIVGRILGACIGGGLEIAARCDLRISGSGGRFGAPIARLGFPMAPREPSVLARVVPAPVLRELLLEARLLDAPRALDLGLIHTVVDDADVAAHAVRRARSIAALSGQAPRINKQTMRHLDAGGPTPAQLQAHFAYADTAQHREGVMAFIEKRPPRFTPE